MTELEHQTDPNQSDGETPYKVPAYQGEDYTTKAVYDAITALKAKRCGPGLHGEDPVADNIWRAQRAAEAVRGYAQQDAIFTGESVFLAISDMMNDLRHLLDFVAIDLGDSGDPDAGGAGDGYPTDFDELAARDLHYQDEIRGVF